MAAALSVSAQNVQFEISPRCAKGVIELTTFSDNTFGYCYTEMVLSGNEATSMFSQVIWEQKWWETPIFGHVEFRTGLTNEFSFGNTGIAGVAWSILPSENATLVAELLYRRENGKNMAQITFVGGFSYDRWNYSGYCDLWRDGLFRLYSENKFFFRFSKTLHIGVNLEFGVNNYEGETFSFTPYAIIRKDF